MDTYDRGSKDEIKERLPSRRPFPLNTNQLNNTSQVSGIDVLFPTGILLEAYALLFVPGVEFDDVEREGIELVLAGDEAAAPCGIAVIVP